MDEIKRKNEKWMEKKNWGRFVPVNEEMKK